MVTSLMESTTLLQKRDKNLKILEHCWMRYWYGLKNKMEKYLTLSLLRVINLRLGSKPKRKKSNILDVVWTAGQDATFRDDTIE